MNGGPALGDVMPNYPRRYGISRSINRILCPVTVLESKMTKLILTVSLAALLALPVAAQTPLNKEARINSTLIAGQVGDTIRKTCPSISAKMFVVLGELNALEDYARDQGYTEAEVKAFLKDKTEKARIKVAAAEYLKKAGVIEGDVETYCVVGRAEIEKGTLAGSLLRSWK